MLNFVRVPTSSAMGRERAVHNGHRRRVLSPPPRNAPCRSHEDHRPSNHKAMPVVILLWNMFEFSFNLFIVHPPITISIHLLLYCLWKNCSQSKITEPQARNLRAKRASKHIFYIGIILRAALILYQGSPTLKSI